MEDRPANHPTSDDAESGSPGSAGLLTVAEANAWQRRIDEAIASHLGLEFLTSRIPDVRSEGEAEA
jgi:hypothetical protein